MLVEVDAIMQKVKNRKKIWSTIGLVVLFIIQTPITQGQPSDILFNQYTNKDGLSHNTINCIAQDSLGFLWMGTMNGLNRFDGNEFKIYKFSPEDRNSLCHNLVKSICSDKDGNIWVGTANGVSVLNRLNNRFSHFSTQDSSGLSHNNIEMVYCDRKGSIWVATQGGGLNKFNETTKTFTHFQANNRQASISNNNVHWIFEDRDEQLWIGTEGGGLHRMHNDEKGFDFFQFEPEGGNYQALNCVRSINQDWYGNIWVGTWGGGTAMLDQTSGQFQYYRKGESGIGGISDRRVISILSSSDRQLWFGTEDGGLNTFDFNSQTFKKVPMELLSPFGLKSSNIKAIFEDRSNRIWLGTSGGGVYSFDLEAPPFSLLQIKDVKSNKLVNQDIYAIATNQNSIWVGTNGSGLYHGELIQTETTQDMAFKAVPLASEIVHALSFDHWGRLWVGTLGDGLNLVEFSSDNTPVVTQFTIQKPVNNTISYNDIRCLHHDRRGNLWIGTAGGGLNKMVAAKKGEYYFEHYLNNKLKKGSLSNNDVRAITEDINGNIWIGTANGLNKLPPNGNAQQFQSFFSRTETGLASNWINTLYADNEAFLWIGTDAGLTSLNTLTNEMVVYTEKDGLVNNIVKGITQDKNGNLWISSVNGLSLFDKSNSTFYNFFESDGLLSNEFNFNAMSTTTDGQVFIGSTSGINYFNPYRVLQNNYSSPLYFTGFKLFNQAIEAGQVVGNRILLQRDISLLEEIELKFNENSFSFEFAALDFAHAQKIAYQYMLDGFDENWQQTNASHRIATYTNLNSGTYLFKVKALSNIPGVQTPEKSVQIIIRPPYWKTWWAYLLYFGIIALIFFVVKRNAANRASIREDLRLARLEGEKERELIQMKQRFLMNISHEFKTPLTLISGPIDTLESTQHLTANDRKLIGLIKRNSNVLSRLIMQLIDFSKQERGALKLQVTPTEVQDFVRSIMLSFEGIAKQKSIAFHLNVIPEQIQAWFDTEKMEKVIFNLLSNAFKYTPANGHIEVQIDKEASHLIISVKDTGKGIAPEHLAHIFDRFYQVNPDESETGTGIGLALTKELVELHHGEINVTSQKHGGTCFSVKLPLEESLFANEKKKVSNEIANNDKADSRPEIDIDKTLTEHEKPSVLIVEDNYDMRQYLSHILNNAYKVSVAEDGQEGIEKALKMMPDIIISDVMMPRLDGLSFCQQIKNKVEVSHIPVILLTAKSDKESVLNGYHSGADSYLEKPFDAEILQVRMQSLLQNRQRIWSQLQTHPVKAVSDKKLNKLDREFLIRLEQIVLDNISLTDFKIEELGRQVAMSRTTLYRKVKALSGKTTIEYVRTIRINQALQLLQNNEANHFNVAEKVGFTDHEYFKKLFKKQFGYAPDEI